jgi:hypothetical protein
LYAVEALSLRLVQLPRSILWMRRSRLFSFAVGLVLALTGGTVDAAPIEAAGESASEEKDARSKALHAARVAALSSAIEQLDHAVDPEAQKEVMSKVELWTSSYRVLERSNEGGQLRLRVEFAINLPRLSKRLAVRSAPTRRGFEIRGIEASPSCPDSLGEASTLREALLLAGVPLFDGGDALSLSFDCTSLGRVPATFVHGGRVVLEARLADGRATRNEAIAFGATPDESMRAARDEALTLAAAALDHASSGRVTLRVHNVGDGARVRRLLAALRDGVRGVDAARLRAIEAGGVVQLELEVSASLATLESGIEALSFPDFNFALLPPAPNPAAGAGTAGELGASLVLELEIL